MPTHSHKGFSNPGHNPILAPPHFAAINPVNPVNPVENTVSLREKLNTIRKEYSENPNKIFIPLQSLHSLPSAYISELMVGQSTPKTPCSGLRVWPRNSVAVVAYSTILQNSNTAMQTASHVSLHLIRFESLRPAGAIEVGDRAGVLFCGVAADTRAAGTEPASQQAFAFAILGLHQDAVSAHWLLENYRSVAP